MTPAGVFGVDLSTLVQRNLEAELVPTVLAKMLRYLEDNAGRAPGLFLKSGNKDMVQAFKRVSRGGGRSR